MSQIQVENLYENFTASKDEGDNGVKTTSETMGTASSLQVTSPSETPASSSTANSSSEQAPVKEIVKDTPLYCPYCELQAQDALEFQAHVFGDEHAKLAFFTNKRIDREKRGLTEPAVPRKIDSKKPEPDKKKEPSIFHCQVCVISCNGESAWNAHLCGQKHRKVLEKQGEERLKAKAPSSIKPLIKQHGTRPYDRPLPNTSKKAQPLGQQDFQNYQEPLIGLEYVTEIQVMGQNTRYHCELCDCKFDGNLKFPHLVGAKHRFNVLKIKRPDVAQSVRSQDSNKKRSELTGLLRDEAAKLEKEEGRKIVKLRVEKSPFQKVNSGGAGRGNQNPSNRGQRGASRGANTFGRSQFTSNRGQNTSNRGQSTSFRGQSNNRGAAQTNHAQGGRGRGRGQRGGVQSTSWNQSTPFSYGADSSAYNHYYGGSANSNQGSLLPPEAFNPMNHDQAPWTSSGYKSFGAPSSSNMDYTSWEYPANNVPKPAQQPKKPAASPATSSAGGGLSNVLGDLSKLVSSEDDAAVALQVSNALTQALLTFRMNSIQADGSNPTSQ